MKKKHIFLFVLCFIFWMNGSTAKAAGGSITILTGGDRTFSGVDFLVTDSSGESKTYTTGENGTVSIDNLPFGKTTVELVKAPENYYVGNGSRTFTLYDGDAKVNLSFEFSRREGTVTIRLKDVTTKKPIEDVLFKLFNNATNEIELYGKTDAKGEVYFAKVPFGEYRLEQSTASPGYYMASSRNFKISPGENLVLEVENSVKAKVFTRIAGSDRIKTAIEISKTSYTSSTDVVIVNSSTFPDGLVAGPLAYSQGAPVLLSGSTLIREDILAEIKRLGARNIFILGGPKAVSYEIENYIEDNLGKFVKRIYGYSRYETAVKVGEYIVKNSGPRIKTAYLASGEDFPDALSISAVAAKNGSLLLLTRRNSIPAETLKALKEWNIENVVIVGGNNAIDKSVYDKLVQESFKVERIEGTNRYATSINIAKKYFPDAEKIALTNSHQFADALTGGPYASQLSGPIVLINKSGPSPEVLEYVKQPAIQDIKILGGLLAIPNSAVTPLGYK